MSDLFLSRIRIYPIKACAGTDVQEAHLERRGLRYDRRWMLAHSIRKYCLVSIFFQEKGA